MLITHWTKGMPATDLRDVLSTGSVFPRFPGIDREQYANQAKGFPACKPHHFQTLAHYQTEGYEGHPEGSTKLNCNFSATLYACFVGSAKNSRTFHHDLGRPLTSTSLYQDGLKIEKFNLTTAIHCFCNNGSYSFSFGNANSSLNKEKVFKNCSTARLGILV